MDQVSWFSCLSELSFSRHVFEELRHMHYRDGVGVNRLGYSQQTKEAADRICFMAQQDLGESVHIYEDIAGNRHIVLEPEDPANRAHQALLMGSHLDAVPHGGQYDGIAGIVSGLEVMRAIVKQGIDPVAPLVVTAFISEESSRFEFATSSKIFTGCLNPVTLDRLDNLGSGETLLQAMVKHHGLDGDRIKAAVHARHPLFAPTTAAAFVEAHIQQNDQLARDGFDIGVVTGIKGSFRCGYVKFTGRADHSGACPQEDRQDAGLALAHYIHGLDSELNELRKTYPDLTFSIGDLKGPEKGSVNTISSSAAVLFDIRSASEHALRRAQEITRELADKIANDRNVHVEIDDEQTRLQLPVIMDGGLVRAFNKAARRLGQNVAKTPSGPGHDAGPMQDAVPSIVLFSPHTGGSHNHNEIMTVRRGEDPFGENSPYANTIKLLYVYAMEQIVSPRRPKTTFADASISPFANSLQSRGAQRLDTFALTI